MLELVTTSEEMCYMMALEDVQRLADDTNRVTKKEHAHYHQCTRTSVFLRRQCTDLTKWTASWCVRKIEPENRRTSTKRRKPENHHA